MKIVHAGIDASRFELRIETPNDPATLIVLKTSVGDVPSSTLYRDLEQLSAHGFPGVSIWQVTSESKRVSVPERL
jgi:hypothetical protein